MLLERLWRWRLSLTLAFTGGLAAYLRFVNLGYPNALNFDEAYYARQAYSLIHLGYTGRWSGDPGVFVQGDFSGLSADPDEAAHPPLGKWMISVGIRMFGPHPFGWRFTAAVIGTITVILIVLIARHLFHSLLWGGVAGLFLAIDGEHLVSSRTALLDIFLTFWVVVGFGLLLLDRRRARATLAAKAAEIRARLGLAPDAVIPGIGPGLGFRWWRLAAMMTLGVSAGIKWSGFYFAAFFLALSALWDLVDRRDAGFRHGLGGGVVRSVIPAALLSAVVVPATYVATWASWFASSNAYDRHWAELHPGEGLTWLPAPLRSLAQLHVQLLEFHTTLTKSNGYTHPYSADPIGWLIQWRPTVFWRSQVTGTGDATCGAANCDSTVSSVGNPLIWWLGTAALAYALYRMVAKADMLAATVSIGILGGWLPWFIYGDRLVFTWYTVAFSPWIVLTAVWLLTRIARPPSLKGGWSRRGVIVVAGFVAATVVVSGFFLSWWDGQWLPQTYSNFHAWLGRHWI